MPLVHQVQAGQTLAERDAAGLVAPNLDEAHQPFAEMLVTTLPVAIGHEVRRLMDPNPDQALEPEAP